MLLSQGFFLKGEIAFRTNQNENGFGLSQWQLMKTP
jgi:hypothetical protein